MNEWGVVSVIIVMLGFVVTILALAEKITKPMEKLNCSVVELSTKFDGLTDRIDRDGNNNEKEHIALWGETEKQCEMINDHEIRITVLEKAK